MAVQSTNQKFGEILNINNNTKYSISPNSVKLLPTISNDGNFVKLYTETNMSINKGDYVFIMYDDNQSYDGAKTGQTILDNYYEFSGCTDWFYLKQNQGYEVLNTNDSNNEITIKRYYDSTLNNIKLYNHYLCKIYVNKINFYGGWIDGVCFRSVNLNSQTDTYVDIDIKQCIILSGGTNIGTTAYYIDIKDKYDNKYVSVNSQISPLTKKSINPYKYKNYNYDSRNENPVTSYLTINNKEYGYTNIFYTKFLNSIINNGYYTNCIFSDGTIKNGNFINCKFYNVIVESGNFTNCIIDSTSTWYNGIWYGGDKDCFGPTIWWNGIWNEGVFSEKTWTTGIFNKGVFENSIWNNGIFNGISSIFLIDDNPSFIKSDWNSGTFNGNSISSSNWYGGTFNGKMFKDNSIWNGGSFNNGLFQNSTWYSGFFNNGNFENSTWNSGTFNNGNFNNSIWITGTFNNGVFNTGVFTDDFFKSSGLTNKWIDGTFNGGKFINSFWSNGVFNNGDFTNSMWYNGNFNYGNFNNSTWIYGNWANGVVNNSIFHHVDWSKGTFNSGIMGKKMKITSTIIYDLPYVMWYGGTFNNGIFGNSDNIFYDRDYESGCTPTYSTIKWLSGDFYGGSFFTNRYYERLLRQDLDSEGGGFYGGIFHEGYFYGVLLGNPNFNGQWVNGFFDNRPDFNWTNQIITIATNKNYQITNQTASNISYL